MPLVQYIYNRLVDIQYWHSSYKEHWEQLISNNIHWIIVKLKRTNFVVDHWYPHNFDILAILISWQFWYPDNFDILTILLSWQFWYPGNFDILIILISWQFWYPDNRLSGSGLSLSSLTRVTSVCLTHSFYSVSWCLNRLAPRSLNYLASRDHGWLPVPLPRFHTLLVPVLQSPLWHKITRTQGIQGQASIF